MEYPEIALEAFVLADARNADEVKAYLAEPEVDLDTFRKLLSRRFGFMIALLDLSKGEARKENAAPNGWAYIPLNLGSES